MKYIGCDFHPSFQQVAMLDTETGELVERRLAHGTAEARVFYESLSKPMVVGVEASGNTYWFERYRSARAGDLSPQQRYGLVGVGLSNFREGERTFTDPALFE